MPWTIQTAAKELRDGRLSAVDLLDTCLLAIDRYEPRVHAWVLVDRDSARADAERAAAEMRRGEWRGPLHGIPIGIKDIIDVFDWPTAAGSRLWKHSIARADAPVVQKLRQAGAVLVGKTVTTQYASFDPPPTRNPWDLSRTPGGSSSGSAAAVACGMCLAALATQTGGSITRPASYCGVASIKPTYQLVDTDGVVPLATSMDHVGVMARSVRDLALVLPVLSSGNHNAVPDYVGRWENALGSDPLRRPRLGLLRGLFHEMAHPSVRTMMEQTISTLAARGAEIQCLSLPASFSEVLSRHRTVMAVEAARFHERRLKRHPEDYDPSIRKLLDEGLACPAPEYARCVQHKDQLANEMGALLSGFDALLTPATTCPAPAAATTGDPAFNSPWSYTGLPTISMPAGRSSEGLPLAIQLVARKECEADLFTSAAWCEDAIGLGPLTPPL